MYPRIFNPENRVPAAISGGDLEFRLMSTRGSSHPIPVSFIRSLDIVGAIRACPRANRKAFEAHGFFRSVV
jgi:hypothetical protein